MKSRRWGGYFDDKVDDETWLVYLLSRISPLQETLIEAFLPISRCLAFPNGTCFFMDYRIGQYISKTPRRPYPHGLPLTSVSIYEDGRHFLDIPDDDPFWSERLNEEILIKFLDDHLPLSS